MRLGQASRALLAFVSAAALLAPAPIAQAQSQTVRVELGGTGSASQNLTLPRGRSAIVELPVDARDVLVSNPQVADAVLRTPRRIYVLGVMPGQTDAVFFDGAGRRILSLNIRVDAATGALEDTIRRVAPNARVSVEPAGDSLILTGTASNPLEADRVRLIAERFAGGPDKVLSMLTVEGQSQVMLRVRVVEIQRNAIKQLGFNTQAVLNQVGEPQWLIGQAVGFGVNGRSLGGVTGGVNLDTTRQPFANIVDPITGEATDAEVVDRDYPLSGVKDTAGDPGLNRLNATIQAFERVGLVRTLAEPNLTAVTGEAARFLAGGEFPVPVGVDENGRVSVEYKPFGVGLAFTPVVMSGGRISMKISTEVSELSTNGALNVGTGANALNLPALNVRRAETTVELPSGGAMMIAGLLQEKYKQSIDSLPGMMNVPVIGSLFRSRDFLNEETELVVIVTPYLVDATSPDRLQTPADGLRAATDSQTILLGRLNQVVRGPTAPAAVTATGEPAWKGPVGYVIE